MWFGLVSEVDGWCLGMSRINEQLVRFIDLLCNLLGAILRSHLRMSSPHPPTLNLSHYRPHFCPQHVPIDKKQLVVQHQTKNRLFIVPVGFEPTTFSELAVVKEM